MTGGQSLGSSDEFMRCRPVNVEASPAAAAAAAASAEDELIDSLGV